MNASKPILLMMLLFQTFHGCFYFLNCYFRSEKKLYGKFIDSLIVRAKGGDGGNGKVAFTSLPRKEWAGMQYFSTEIMLSTEMRMNEYI